MADDLSTPLKSRKARAAAKANGRMRLRSNLPWTRMIFGLLLLIAVGVILRIVLIEDPEGGRPSAEMAINATKPANPVAGDVTVPESPPEAGVTVTMPNTTETMSGGAKIITLDDSVPDDLTDLSPTMELAGTPRNDDGAFPDLIEDTQDGGIPRLGPKGETPFAVYARPSVTKASANGRPLIALVVTGMGLNESGTLDAIGKLPPAATLAFAPYSKNLRRTVSAAQANGHELLLEVPLEPFDYPDNDPGPQTLLTGQPPRANIERLFWLMSRFGGYVGLMNNLGARFTSSGADFSPVMEELGVRGLGYLDDGSSNRSLAPQLAASNKVPFARADLMLDSNPAKEPIEAQLAELEARARETGGAIGIISALPVSIETVSAWAQTLEQKGIDLVPVSALMQ